MSTENTEQQKAPEQPKGKAKAEQAKVTEQPKRAIVVQRFRDASNFDQVYEADADVSHFDKARIKDLIDKGLVELK